MIICFFSFLIGNTSLYIFEKIRVFCKNSVTQSYINIPAVKIYEFNLYFYFLIYCRFLCCYHNDIVIIII